MTPALPPPRVTSAAVCLLLVFLVRGCVALATVPPWQNPDEPQHVLAIWFAGSSDRSPEAVGRMEDAILSSMVRHDWWRLVGARQPSPPPTRFDQDPELVKRHFQLPRSDGLYYAMAARIARGDDPEAILRRTRALSLIAGLGIVLLAWDVGRMLLGAWSGIGVMALLALHPQVVLVATTASADAFVGLLSAAMLWAATRSLDAERPIAWLSLAVMLAALSALARRLGVTVVPIAAWVVSVCVAVRSRREAARLVATLAGLSAIVGALVAWSFGDLVRWYSTEIQALLAQRAEPVGWTAGFLGLYHSSWIAAGWLRFAPPDAWRSLLAIFTAAAGLGVVGALVAARSARTRLAIVVAGGAVLLQLASLLVRQYLAGEGGQGRYLSPVAIPLALLVWIGVTGWGPAGWRRVAACALVSGAMLLDAAAWSFVIWPAFSP